MSSGDFAAPQQTRLGVAVALKNWRWRQGGPLCCWAFLLVVGTALASCKPDTKVEAPEIRPVRTVTAARGEAAETVVLTGHVRAEDEPALAFRIGGRVIQRPVNVGDRV